jgi:IclR family transcriptional regulator, KDG regulon repressor
MKVASGTQSIDRVFDILETVANETKGISITELTKRLDLKMSTVSRLVNTLKNRGYLYKNAEINKYFLGIKCIELSSTFLNSLDLKVIAEEIMYELTRETGETAFLALMQDKHVVYIDKTDTSSSLRRLSVIGTSVPFHCTSLGKALLLNKSKDHLMRFVEDIEFIPQTSKTITDKDHFIDEVIDSSKLGYTVDINENIDGVSCVGAPIYDCTGTIVAAISVTGVSAEFSEEKIEKYGELLKGKALEISRKIGYMGT